MTTKEINCDGYCGFGFLSGLDPRTFSTDPETRLDGHIPVKIIEADRWQDLYNLCQEISDYLAVGITDDKQATHDDFVMRLNKLIPE